MFVALDIEVVLPLQKSLKIIPPICMIWLVSDLVNIDFGNSANFLSLRSDDSQRRKQQPKADQTLPKALMRLVVPSAADEQ
jgi:hypothetical protein